ncbi:MAG: extracellular solute-binding protein [Clostridia bacterium]|nr:extracellular solute-binding protein [Clostridia bacterium]
MKFKHLARVMTAAIGLCAISSCFCACAEKNDPNTLNVICYDGGYGSTWLDKTIEIFEQTHEGYKVNPTYNKNASVTIKTNIDRNNNIDDLYISVGIDWQSYAAKGQLAPLDDLYEREVDGIKIKDKLTSCYANSVYTTGKDREEHAYRTPWIAGVGGIFYNVKMFEENNWEVPTTYEELVTLCQTIVDAKIRITGSDEMEYVKPFVWTGGEAYYWDYTLFTWWGQLAGKEKLNKFFQYDDPSLFNPDNTDSAYSDLKTAYTMWYDLIASHSEYSMPDCTGKAYMSAQLDFIGGKAAMMPNGQWLYNEMRQHASVTDFEMALMPTPHLSTAQYPNTYYCVGEDQSIVIPASSTKQDLAKDFIAIMASNQGCDIFLEQANGILAFNKTFDASDSKYDTFQKSIINVQTSPNTVLFTDYSPSTLGKLRKVGVWPLEARYNSAANKTENAAPGTFFNDIYTYVQGNWASWNK